MEVISLHLERLFIRGFGSFIFVCQPPTDSLLNDSAPRKDADSRSNFMLNEFMEFRLITKASELKVVVVVGLHQAKALSTRQ